MRFDITGTSKAGYYLAINEEVVFESKELGAINRKIFEYLKLRFKENKPKQLRFKEYKLKPVGKK